MTFFSNEISGHYFLQYIPMIMWHIWIGLIECINIDENDFGNIFMHPAGPNPSFNWPSQHDEFVVCISNIL